MHSQGQAHDPSNPRGMPATDDEIREKYLERAIRELNTFARELQSCPHCPRGALLPVLGSGNALMKSLRRLSIDPLAVYGTLCVKCPVPDPALADPGCVARLIEELAIVQPKIVVVMGPDALAVLNELDVPLSHELAADPGQLQRFTPSIEALYVPNIDEALDE